MAYEPLYTTSRALVIGIDQYQDPRLHPLGKAEDDARRIADILHQPPYSFDEVTLLLGHDAGKPNILEALYALRSARMNDRLLVYFAGHGYVLTNQRGYETGYLACYDTRQSRDYSALKIDTVTELREYTPAKHITFIFDACFSGTALGLTRAVPDVAADKFLLKRAYQVISAGTADQAVQDARSMTTVLVDELRRAVDGRDLLTVNDLGLRVQRRIVSDSHNGQIPQFGHLTHSQGGDLVLYVPSQAKPTDNLPQRLARALISDDADVRYFAIAEAERLVRDPVYHEPVVTVLETMVVEDGDAEVRRRALDALRSIPVSETVITQPPANEPVISTPQAPRKERLAAAVLNVLPEPFAWCEVDGVRDWIMKTDEGEFGPYTIQPFYIAKYPVTYEQFQVFIDDPDGFTNPQWWEGLAADADPRKQPGEQRFTHAPNLPRENVSWYDAVAFCRWLSVRAGADIRLPAEWEWQWAAQGPDGLEYPYGSDFDSSKCNTDESGNGKTTPVTRYSDGASPFHVLDMSGNVFEWCLNEYSSPENTGLSGSDVRVVRGGSWDLNRRYARASLRGYLNPLARLNRLGFRVVCGSRPPSR